MIKNADSQRYKHLMNLKAPFRLLLTGTPLQNNLLELLSLLTFIMPQFFQDNNALQRLFAQKSATDTELERQRIERAKTMMSPFVLRRRKANVLKDLPEKKQVHVDCELTVRQKELYHVHLLTRTHWLKSRETETQMGAHGAKHLSIY
jgi:SWI/SNF-related matrix-associated actin-dependent regulator 1 of chromatin subfamily A